MKDEYGREIDYMRISVTDRCNLRCRYCMPEEGIESVAMGDLLSYEEIARVVRAAARLGIRRVRLTGGEPLVRLHLHRLIAMIRQVPGIEGIALTSNGVLLKEMLPELTESGLGAVNISLDTLDRDEFIHITGRDELGKVLSSIHAALYAGLKVKVNAVLLPKEMYLRGDFRSMFAIARNLPVDLRFIELMPIGEGGKYTYTDGRDLVSYLKETYPGVREDKGTHGAGPATYFKIPGFLGGVGLIGAMHGKFCDRCNRIRLSAAGEIKPCLCYADTYDIRSVLRADGSTESDIEEALRRAIRAKPGAHCFEDGDKISEKRKMVSIGG